MPDMMNNEDYANRAGGTASSAAIEQPDASQLPAAGVNTGLAPNAESAMPEQQQQPQQEPQNTGVPAKMVQQMQKEKGNGTHQIFRSIFDALAGPSVSYSIDNNGNMVETPVKRTKTQLANSIVAGALTGLFAGIGEHGPNAEAKAATKGFAANNERLKDIKEQGQQMAVGDYNRRMATLEANLRLRQNAMQLYTLGSKAMEPYVNDGKALVGMLQDQPGALLEGGRTFAASEVPDLMKKYNVTNEALIPVGQEPVIGTNGQPVTDASGVPKTQFKYMVVNPNFDISIPDDLLKKFQKYHIPGFVDSQNNPINLPKDAKTKALVVANAMHQVAAFEAFEEARKQYLGDFDKPAQKGQGSTKLPSISKSNPDPMIQKMVDRYATQQGVDKALARAIVQVESGGNPKAVSHAGAKGVMQIMPVNYDNLGIKDPFDPEQNIRGGMKLFKELLDRFGSVKLALAAYNSSPKAVVDAGYEVPDIKETKDYVKSIMAIAGIRDEDEPVEVAEAKTPEGK